MAKLQIDATDKPPAFDPAQVARALDNFVTNALQHAPSGGRVEVQAHKLSVGDSHVLRLEVVDNGPGVSADDREHIFEPFMTWRVDGSGLGLAVVREIASAHRGWAYLADYRDAMRFVIELP